jgi:flagellar biogenesis protein FliO
MLLMAVFGACLAAEAPTAYSSIPFKRESSAAESDSSRLGLGLGFCALLAVGAIWLVRRRNGSHGRGIAGRKQARVVETSRLSPKSMLHVVEFAGNRYLLTESENGVHCVASTPARHEPLTEQPG